MCIPLSDCQEAYDLLEEAKDTSDTARKNHIVQLLRGRVCRKLDRAVCCNQDIPDFAVSSGSKSSSDSNGLKKLGSFKNFFHDISGDVYQVDSKTVLIKGFTYDGEGPDTFFLAGSSGRPSSSGQWVLPWPADGQVYSYNDDIPLITRSFDGSEDITLKLPQGVSVDDLRYLNPFLYISTYILDIPYDGLLMIN